MSGSSQRSGRVVIMDDVSWSEPTPQARRSAELGPPEWVAPQSRPANPEARTLAYQERHAAQMSEDPYRAADDFDAALGEVVNRWQTEMAPEPVVIDGGELDEERIWGPRPRLMAAESGGRRTVVITGRMADRHVDPRATSRDSSLHARHGFAADRTAMWAVLLCVILLLVALTSH